MTQFDDLFLPGLEVVHAFPREVAELIVVHDEDVLAW